MDERSSWTRIAITLAVDWRFVLAIVILVLVLTSTISASLQKKP